MIELNNSWYNASRNWHGEFPRLKGELTVDVCVIGGGITGLTCALHLAEKGYQVALLEGNTIGYGASGRSGGQMIFGFAAEQPTLEKLVGKEDALRIWQSGLEGIELLRERVRRHQIDCDLLPGHAHVAIKPRQERELAEWAELLQHRYQYQSLELWDQNKTQAEINSSSYRAALFDSNSGHIHPLNYTLGLARAAKDAGVNIFEQSPALNLSGDTQQVIQSHEGHVKAKYTVLAGNAYLSGIGEKLHKKVMPVGTYICASEPLGRERALDLIRNNIAVADINFVLDYYRLSNDYRLLFGGRVSYSTVPPLNLAKAMGKRMTDVFPSLNNVNVDYAWGGNVAITMNRAPHFGRLKNNIYFAQGFSGHGIAATGLAGKLMADAISGTAERFDVFTKIPHLAFPGGRYLRTPTLVLAMAWFRLQDLLP